MQLNYARLGREDLPAVLCLHGITESNRYFTTRVGSLAESFHLVLPDLPGFGLSPKPVIDYRVETFARAVRTFIEEQGLEARPLHLVGHSLGSIVALEYAAQHPERIGKIVLLSLPRFTDPDTAHRIFWSGSPSYRKLLQQHSLVENFSQFRRLGLGTALRTAVGIPVEVLVDCRRFTFQSLTSTLENCLIHYSVDPLLERMPARSTLLVHGRGDMVAPFGEVEPLPSRHAHMALRAFDGAGHHVLHTHTRDCVELIRSFLA